MNENATVQESDDARMSTKERMIRQDSGRCPYDTYGASAEDDDACNGVPEGEKWARRLGKRGENAACDFLKRRGYDIIERNWTCPAGEADVIAKDEDGTIVFVEVKTRNGVEAGLPAEAVTPQKRARYERIAGFFLADYDGEECRIRFDVIAILVVGENRALLRHYINAFGARC